MKKIILSLLLSSFCAGLSAAPTSVRNYEDPASIRVVHREYVHKYGLPINQDEWNKRGQNGKIISKLNNGVVQTKTYRNGILDGEASYSFPHREEIETVEIYANGVLQKTTYFNTLRHAYQEVQLLPNGSRCITLWFENGSPQSIETFSGDFLEEGEYYTIDNQIESKIHNSNGERYRRDSFGQLISVDTFEGGQLTCSKTFYPNGSPKEITTYAEGLLHGLRKTYHFDGAPDCVEEWNCGMQEGITTHYVNGELYAEVPYYQGMKQGIERKYSDNGKTLAAEVSWSNDLKHGPSCTCINGQPIQNEWFYKGKQVSKKNFDVLNTVPSIH